MKVKYLSPEASGDVPEAEVEAGDIDEEEVIQHDQAQSAVVRGGDLESRCLGALEQLDAMPDAHGLETETYSHLEESLKEPLFFFVESFETKEACQTQAMTMWVFKSKPSRTKI